MRGVQVQGMRFRQLRRARGLTQQELARLAGVAERTVRNAESGQRVRLDFLQYLAGALGVKVLDLVHDRDELRVAYGEEERAERASLAMLAFACDRDLSEIRSLIDDQRFRLLFPGPNSNPFVGEYRGIDGLRELMDRAEAILVYEKPTAVTEIRSSGSFVVLSGVDTFRSQLTGHVIEGWWQHIFEFEEDRVVRVDVLSDTGTFQAAFPP